jgi:hypothetical protein
MILAYKGVDFRYAFFIVSIWISKCLELHTCILFKHITKVSTASKHPIRNIFIFLHLLKKMELRSMCVLYHELKKNIILFLEHVCACFLLPSIAPLFLSQTKNYTTWLRLVCSWNRKPLCTHIHFQDHQLGIHFFSALAFLHAIFYWSKWMDSACQGSLTWLTFFLHLFFIVVI